jgi:hydrophobic/amphiphilic exporter-1 (mainly G- bacteria), HAE1 family
MISVFFINRPVLANVLAIVIVLLGAVALYALPVAQYPNVVPPTVSVTTRYPGASAETVMNTVALPIEEQVNGVQGMLYMQSTSTSDGSYTLTVTFQIGTDLNFAQVLVQNRVSAALASLPEAVQLQGVNVQQKSTSILQIVTLTAPDNRYDSLFLSNYATITLVPELSRVPGVGNVNVFGVGQYSMRIWLDPQKLYARGLTPADVINVVQQQSQQVTAGQIGTPPAPAGQDFQYTVNVEGRLTDPVQFGNIIVKVDSANGGQITRVKDVARVELGAQTYSIAFALNGKPAAGIAIYQLPDANALNVATAVNARMAELAKSFPQGLSYSVPFDTTKFVDASIHEVYKTLLEAAVLVLIVILLFLQDWRAMLVPATTVPVTIIGAFAAMAAMGFTVNLSTLFAIILAIGIVVDDAIVIVEGASHHIERGLSPHDAAVKAMSELLGPIIGITLVLVSVFIPAAFLPRAVCPGDRSDCHHQRDQCRDVEADAMRTVAAPSGASREAQFRVSRLQPDLRSDRTRLRRVDRSHGRAQWHHGDRRIDRGRYRRMGYRAPAHGVHPDRGPGLRHGRRATSGWRCTRPHASGT